MPLPALIRTALRRGLALALLICLPLAWAQTPLRLVTGFPPGGSIDALARLYVDELARELGRPVIVDSRAGAGGLLAVQNVLNGPADGNAILLTPDTNIVAYPHTVRRAPYDALKDLVPVGFAGTYEMAMGVRNDAKVPDLKTFLASARADSKLAAFGSPGGGTLPHFFGLALAEATGIPMVHVPYKGTGPAITDTIGGSLPAIFSPTATMIQQHRAKTLRVLATSGPTRGATTPEVPTFRELGLPQMEFTGWFGFFLPAATPAAEVRRFNEAINRIVARPEFAARLAPLGAQTRQTGVAEFQRLIASESERWMKVIKSSGFTADN